MKMHKKTRTTSWPDAIIHPAARAGNTISNTLMSI
jgi:hypothetical protein